MSGRNYTIGISSELFLYDGAATFFPNPDKSQLSRRDRRISRVKTLDGGAVFVDGGVCAADRTLKVVTNYTDALWETLSNIFDNAAWVRLSCREGCFLSKLQDIDAEAGRIALTVLIGKDLTA